MIAVRPPGDKSISHRALLIAGVADGVSTLRHLGDGADVWSTIGVVRTLGATVDVVEGPTGIDATVTPSVAPDAVGLLDCGNSGTTARLALGLLAGLGVGARLDGDGSLRGRPMRRVVYPLQAMGARIDHEGEADRLPVTVHPRATGALRTLRHRPRVASAQVKSAILLAGVLDGVAVEVREPARSRDHTERMLAACGAPVERREEGEGAVAAFEPGSWSGALRPLDLEIPGDPSSAAFMIGAALVNGRPIRIEAVSDNPTRNGVLEVLEEMGAAVSRENETISGGEPVCTWIVEPPDRLRSFDLGGTRIAGLIDELPLLAVLAARSVGRSSIRDAAELRVKESDRIAWLARNLTRIGVTVTERPDGLDIEGTSARLAGRVESGGDHRIEMAFGVLAAAPASDIEQEGRGCAAVSYPRFWEDLRAVTTWTE
ncbi:MAG: 3-phosphoshikimate 1-carboxyvinyltransferase [Gemmatimonadota bacterium]|nr:3-phosphoshikimate 1-carboxyvinyltransferase [Gemmatimonadota bacterium]